MNRDYEAQFPSEPSELLRSALHQFVDVGLEALASWLRQTSERVAAPTEAAHDDADAAAALLGVERGATVADIRKAFRARIKGSMATGQFHDQAGGTTDSQARDLIDAKNLLLSLTGGAKTSFDVA